MSTHLNQQSTSPASQIINLSVELVALYQLICQSTLPSEQQLASPSIPNNDLLSFNSVMHVQAGDHSIQACKQENLLTRRHQRQPHKDEAWTRVFRFPRARQTQPGTCCASGVPVFLFHYYNRVAIKSLTFFRSLWLSEFGCITQTWTWKIGFSSGSATRFDEEANN